MIRAAGWVALALALLLPAAPSARADTPRLLGVNEAATPGQRGALTGFVRHVGLRPKIVMWYQTWQEPLYYDAQARALRAHGPLPVITWRPMTSHGGIPLKAIARGRWDRYLRRSARRAKVFRGPLAVRLAHEMNLSSSAYGPTVHGNRPADFRRAWRHVVRLFRRAGARNVRWVWSPNVDCLGRCPFEAFFPGDAWVDWVALDGYNGGPYSRPGPRWRSLARVFGPSYDRLVRLSRRPVMIGETSSVEQGGSKARWILQGLLKDIPRRLPRVRAVIWFDRRKEHDWRFASSPSALAAFRVVAHSPLYGGLGARAVPFAPPALLPSVLSPATSLLALSPNARVSGGRARVALSCRPLLGLPCQGAIAVYDRSGRSAGWTRYTANRAEVTIPLAGRLSAALRTGHSLRVHAAVFPEFGALAPVGRSLRLIPTRER